MARDGKPAAPKLKFTRQVSSKRPTKATPPKTTVLARKIPAGKARKAAFLLNKAISRGASVRLQALTGASLATVKGWQADTTAGSRKEMSATARRVVALLLVLHARGVLDDELLDAARSVEKHMLDGKGRLAAFLAQLPGSKMGEDEND